MYFLGVERLLSTLKARGARVAWVPSLDPPFFGADALEIVPIDPARPVTRRDIEDLLPHLAYRRRDIVNLCRDEAARDTPGPVPGVTHPDRALAGWEVRVALFEAMRLVAAGFRGRVVWFSRYTRVTGRIDERDTCFPAHATQAAVAYTEPWHDEADPFAPGVEHLTAWHPIPDAHPPAGWKNPEPEKKRRRFNPWAHFPKEADGNLPD